MGKQIFLYTGCVRKELGFDCRNKFTIDALRNFLSKHEPLLERERGWKRKPDRVE